MPEVVLYHVPPSYYSQIARLVLAEKGVAWISRFIAAGPPICESYQPWYMRLNPGGTVPTLVHGHRVIPETIDIARYVDANFDGPPLIPAGEAERAEMERWLGKMYEISVREISYAKLRRIGARVNALRMRNLGKRIRKHPDMAQVFQAKLKDIEDFSNNAANPDHMNRMMNRLGTILDEMEAVLATRSWLAGADYSLADVFWTVGVARFALLGKAPLDGRPALADWYARVKARPSFVTADIWESFKISKMLPILVQKLGPRLAAILLVLGGLCALACWGLG